MAALDRRIFATHFATFTFSFVCGQCQGKVEHNYACSAPSDKCSLVTEAGGSGGDLNTSDQGSAPRPSVPSVTGKPKIKKPPRKSKLQEEQKSVKNLTESGSGENWEEKNNEGESPAVSSSAGRMTAIMS